MALREIITDLPAEMAAELQSMNVDPGGVTIMAAKGTIHRLRVRNLSSPAANILKQEMLSIGGDCATSRTVILGDEAEQDVLIIGTRRHLTKAVTKLKSQPFGLKNVARKLDAFLNGGSFSAQLPAEPLAQLARDGVSPLVMGILNVTEDSFADGGKYTDPAVALAHGMAMIGDGADIIDVGGESTRPGADVTPADIEIARVVPVITGLAAKAKRPLSIDTMKSSVAEAALNAGATMINDVSAGRHDERMLPLAGERGCPIVLMHMLGMPKSMQESPKYDNLMDDLHRFFDERLEAAGAAGIREENIILDPGIGFGKTIADNYVILRRLRELKIFGRPLLVGHSRKSFMKNDIGDTPEKRLEETITAGTIAMLNGANLLRVHDILPAIKSRTVVNRTLGDA